MSSAITDGMFTCLPADFVSSFLAQAWEQLDQREFYGIVPCVCRSWRQGSYAPSSSSSTSSSRSLMVTPASEASFKQLLARIRDHGPILHQLYIRCSRLPCGVLFTMEAKFMGSLAASPSASHLRSLTITYWQNPLNLTVLSSFPQLTALTMSHCTYLSPGILSQGYLQFEKIPQLRSLDLSYNRSYIPHDAIAPLQQLTSLSLIGNGVKTDAALTTIWTLPQLQLLELGFCSIEGEPLSGLTATGCKDLALLSLGLLIDDADAPYMKNWLMRKISNFLGGTALQALKSLDISYTGLGGWSKEELSQLLFPLTTSAPSLRDLVLVGQGFGMGEIAGALTMLTQLTSVCLEVAEVLLVSEVSELVRGLTRLRELHLWSDVLHSRDLQEELQQLREVCSHLKFTVKLCVG